MSSRLSKPFDPELYKKNDEPGKEVVRKYLEGLGYLVANHPNKYKADMIVLEFDPIDRLYKQIALAEAGLRPSWNSHKWPETWDLRVEHRKGKYSDEGPPVWVFVVNKMKTAMVSPKYALSEYAVAGVNNKYFPDKNKPEPNFIIPKDELTYIELVPRILKPTTDEDLI